MEGKGRKKTSHNPIQFRNFEPWFALCLCIRDKNRVHSGIRDLLQLLAWVCRFQFKQCPCSLMSILDKRADCDFHHQSRPLAQTFSGQHRISKAPSYVVMENFARQTWQTHHVFFGFSCAAAFVLGLVLGLHASSRSSVAHFVAPQLATHVPVRPLGPARHPHPVAPPASLRAGPGKAPVAPGQVEANVNTLKNELQRRFPTEPLGYFDDAFLQKLMQKGRPVEYYVRKLSDIVMWRKINKVDGLLDRQFERLDPSIMFWHAEDQQQRPVLYVRPGLVNMKAFEAERTYFTVVSLLEEGIKAMKPGVVEYSVVIDTSGVGPEYFLPGFIKQLFSLAAGPYRNRLGNVIVGPTNRIVNTVWAVASPVIPTSFRGNVVLTKDPMAALRKYIDPAQIPAGVFKA